MTRCIYIATVGRSGSSALAGALHQAGISFGEPDDLMGAHRTLNPRGHFEMHTWFRAERGIAEAVEAGREPDAADLERIAELSAQRSEQHPVIWGVKSARPLALRYVWPLLPKDTLLLLAKREFTATVASYMVHGKLDEETARQKVTDYYTALRAGVASIGIEPIAVCYEHLIQHPDITLGWVLRVCYGGKQMVTTAQIEAAVDWIEPALKHY